VLKALNMITFRVMSRLGEVRCEREEMRGGGPGARVRRAGRGGRTGSPRSRRAGRGANGDFRGGIQTEDDGADSCALLIGVVSAVPESAHVAVGVQLAEGCRVAVAGSHDIDTGCASVRPAELYAVALT
jgi:hypothetical protein